MLKQYLVSFLILTAILTVQPDKPVPQKVDFIIGNTQFNSIYNKGTGQWDVTWNPRYAATAANSPYYFSVSLSKALFNIQL